jgi:hypothetical protein
MCGQYYYNPSPYYGQNTSCYNTILNKLLILPKHYIIVKTPTHYKTYTYTHPDIRDPQYTHPHITDPHIHTPTYYRPTHTHTHIFTHTHT